MMKMQGAGCINPVKGESNLKSKGMRLWAGQQKKGVVRNGKWEGAEPLWNVGIHLRSDDVKGGLKVSEVCAAVEETLKQKFPQYGLEISPKAKDALAGKLDGLNSFPH